MAYNYTQLTEHVSAFQWDGTVPGDVPAWFNDLQDPVNGPIYYPIDGGALGVSESYVDRVTGLFIPPRIVAIEEWIVKHGDDRLEIVKHEDFVARYAVSES